MGSPRAASHRKRLGLTVRSRRLSLQLSQEELAERADCHRNYVGSVERGEQNLTVDMLIRFAKALGCSVAELMKAARM